MNDLVEFLRARLDEDQWIAEGAAKANGMTWAATVTFPAHGSDSTDDHIARHDPARVLREVEAKHGTIREILAECEGAGFDHNRGIYGRTLRALALPYADHPEFREGWKP